MDVEKKLVALLAEYFNIGDSYAYNLTRVKSAFACGTVGLDDFEEFDDETVEDIASYLIHNGVTVQEHGYWETVVEVRDNTVCGNGVKIEYKRCSCCKNPPTFLENDFCGHCGAKLDLAQPLKEE